MVEKGQTGVSRVNESAPDDQPFIGAFEAPEIFIDGFQGVAVHNGVLKINLFTIQAKPEDAKAYRKVVAKLSMSLATLIQIQSALTNVLNDFERDGLIKRIEGASSDATKHE